MTNVWLNGEFVDEAVAAVSIRDTGLLHAAGVFTTMRARDGAVIRLAEHLARLRTSCEVLFVPLPIENEALGAAVVELLDRNALSDARLRLTVTRGASSIDPLSGLRLKPNVLLTASEFEAYPDDYYQRGMTVMLMDDQKLNHWDVQAGHKTLNYFSRIAALREANRRGAGEALWFDDRNLLQSGSISNVFVVLNGTLITPPTTADLKLTEECELNQHPARRRAVLPGITRAAILAHADSLSIPVARLAVTIDKLLAADEVFLTNSIMGVMPVCRIERHAVGAEKPGPLTRALLESPP